MQSHQTESVRPLSSEEKFACIRELRNIAGDALDQALIYAVMPPHLFSLPNSINDKLSRIQQVFRDHEKSPGVREIAEQLIIAYMQKEGCRQFKMLLANTLIEEAEWNAKLLHCLVDKLNIKVYLQQGNEMNMSPLVQSTIKDGKVYWRVLLGDKVILDRHPGKARAAHVVFTAENSWLMDWKLFREFKDSGKRFSPIKITKDRFISQMDPQFSSTAGLIWDDLRQVGIINDKCRLSDGWRAISNFNVTLNILEKSSLTKRDKTVWYRHISELLYTLANTQQLAETLDALPESQIFRNERTKKNWAGTGRLTNQGVTLETITQLWDVSVYHDLTAHRYIASKDKKKLQTPYEDEILNYDHIPSKVELKERPSVIKTAYDASIEQLNLELADLEEQGVPHGHTFKTHPSRTNELSKSYATKMAEKEAMTKLHAYEIEQLSYTISVPDRLHADSATHKKKPKEQIAFKGNVFLRDVSTHLKHIEESPEKYSLTYLHFFNKILGAFRYLYHAECKPPVPLCNTGLYLGRISHALFRDPNRRREIDDMFIQKAKTYMSKR